MKMNFKLKKKIKTWPLSKSHIICWQLDWNFIETVKEHWIPPWVKCSLLSNKLKQEFVFTKPQPELSFNSSVPLLLTHHFLPTQRCGQQHTQCVRWSSRRTYLEDTLLVPFTHLLGPHTTPHQHHCMLPRPSYKLWRIPDLSATT